jgi:hypothetical protein
MLRIVTALLGAPGGRRTLLFGGRQSAALSLPLVHVDVAIGQPTVKNLAADSLLAAVTSPLLPGSNRPTAHTISPNRIAQNAIMARPASAPI